LYGGLQKAAIPVSFGRFGRLEGWNEGNFYHIDTENTLKKEWKGGRLKGWKIGRMGDFTT